MIVCNPFKRLKKRVNTRVIINSKPTIFPNKNYDDKKLNFSSELLKNFWQQIQKLVGLLGPGHYCGHVKTLLLRGNSFLLLLLGRALPQPSDSHKAWGSATRQETAKDHQLGKKQQLEKAKKSTTHMSSLLSYFRWQYSFFSAHFSILSYIFQRRILQSCLLHWRTLQI